MNQACVFVKQTRLWRSTGGEFVFVLYLRATLCSLFVPVCNRAATKTVQLGRNSIFQLLTFDLLLLPFSENMICADNWIAQEIEFIQSWLYYFMTVYQIAVLQPQFLSFPPAVFHSKLKNASLYNYLICLPTIAAVLESILKSSRENGKCLRNLPNLLKTCWKLNSYWKKKEKKIRIKGRKKKNHNFFYVLLQLRAYLSKVGQWDCG